ncbi:MAG: polyphosphate kinase 1 [Desulfovibrio sp.]|jgi:polyphosphate kinase|nr:polyphosphate kinase 1 [Desulfovibrio sp.]
MDPFCNRELSWLAFNRRVLQEAEDDSVPLMQRLRFLGIYSNNNDEFIKVRLARLVHAAHDGKTRKVVLPGGYTPQELVSLIDVDVNAGQRKFTEIYERILEEMAGEEIHVVDETGLDGEQIRFCRRYVLDVVSRRVVPLFLNRTVRLPFLPDDEIYFAVCMDSGGKRKKRFAILQTPVNNSCPRFVKLPSKEGRHDVILLDDIIRLCLDEIFFMFSYHRIQAFMFKLVRDASFNLDDGIDKSLLKKMEEGLEQRMRGKPVRFIYDREMPDELAHLLVSKLGLKEGAVEPGRRYHMLRDLMKFPVIRQDLEDSPAPPLTHPGITPCSSIFHKITHQDILLAFPYQSFDHVIDFLREAAISPRVESIYITLYRLAYDSRIVTALASAAKNGKKVTAYVELLARFDEEHNVSVIDTLQEAGVAVIHATPSLKVHCKVVLVQCKDQKTDARNYVYVGTGNFNEDTARIYSDFGMFTSDRAFANDARALFTFLGNMHFRFTCKRFLVSPFDMRRQIGKLISNEIRNARKNKKAYIWIKCNNITDVKIAKKLYHAGKNGVEIRLIVRSACIIKTQVPQFSENIKAISIVDKYLEHARLMFFCNGGDEAVYISSADLMTRNLDRRVEVAAPVLDKRLKNELRCFFEIQWADNTKARDLASLDANDYVRVNGAVPLRAQDALYHYYANRVEGADQ